MQGLSASYVVVDELIDVNSTQSQEERQAQEAAEKRATIKERYAALGVVLEDWQLNVLMGYFAEVMGSVANALDSLSSVLTEDEDKKKPAWAKFNEPPKRRKR